MSETSGTPTVAVFLPPIKRYRGGGKPALTPAERTILFWSKVQRGAPDACWPWTGARLPHGYGQFCLGVFEDGRRSVGRAHCIAWQLANNRLIPKGLVVRHAPVICDNPPCCNPAHLLLGTQADNVEDARGQGKYREGALRRWQGEWRARAYSRAVFEEAMAAPWGGIAAIARAHGVNEKTLAIAVQRHRARQQPAPLAVSA